MVTETHKVTTSMGKSLNQIIGEDFEQLTRKQSCNSALDQFKQSMDKEIPTGRHITKESYMQERSFWVPIFWFTQMMMSTFWNQNRVQ